MVDASEAELRSHTDRVLQGLLLVRAGEAQWVEVLTAVEAKSATLTSYRMLALCHLLHDEMCIDSLLEEPDTYNRVLLQCLTSAGSQTPVRTPSHQCSATSQSNTIIMPSCFRS